MAFDGGKIRRKNKWPSDFKMRAIKRPMDREHQILFFLKQKKEVYMRRSSVSYTTTHYTKACDGIRKSEQQLFFFTFLCFGECQQTNVRGPHSVLVNKTPVPYDTYADEKERSCWSLIQSLPKDLHWFSLLSLDRLQNHCNSQSIRFFFHSHLS